MNPENNGAEDVFEVARLTPTGRGAVACVGVRGFRACEAVRERWRRVDGRDSSDFFDVWTPESASRPFFGLFRLDENDDLDALKTEKKIKLRAFGTEKATEEADSGAFEEIVTRRRTPTALEFGAHGGDAISSALVRFFVGRGATLVSADDWERAVESQERELALSRKKTALDSEFNGDESNGWRRLDALFFAAADELATRTSTETTAKFALDQRVAWKNWLVATRSAVEVAADSVEPARTETRRRLTQEIAELESRFELGQRLTAPFVVLLTGVPNAGKSELTNAALGFERVVVSATSGTTRDLVGAAKIIGGWNFQLVDSAGLRETTDPVERLGTQLAVDAARRADVVVRLYDATRSKKAQDEIFEAFFNLKNAKKEEVGEKMELLTRRTIFVLNKIDLPREEWSPDWRDFDEFCSETFEKKGENNKNNEENCGEARRSNVLPVSARDGRGVDAFLQAIFAATVGTFGCNLGANLANCVAPPTPWRVEQLVFLNALRAAVVRDDFAVAAQNIGLFEFES